MPQITKTDLKAKLDRIPPEKRKEAIQRLLDNGYQVVDSTGSADSKKPEKSIGNTLSNIITPGNIVNALGKATLAMNSVALSQLPNKQDELAKKKEEAKQLPGLGNLFGKVGENYQSDLEARNKSGSEWNAYQKDILTGARKPDIGYEATNHPLIGPIVQGVQGFGEGVKNVFTPDETPSISPTLLTAKLSDPNVSEEEKQSLQDQFKKQGETIRNKASGLIGGGVGLVASPFSAALNIAPVPNEAKAGLGSLFSVPGEVAKQAYEDISPMLGADKNSEQFQKDKELIANITNAGLLAHGIKKGKEMKSLSKIESELVKPTKSSIMDVLGKVDEQAKNPNWVFGENAFGGTSKNFQESGPTTTTSFEKSQKLNRLEKKTIKAGTPTTDLNLIKKFTPNEKGFLAELIKKSQEKLRNPAAPNAFDLAGGKLENFISDVQGVIKNKGKVISEQRKGLGNIILDNVQDQKNTFQKFLKDELNVKIGEKGELDFSNSRIAQNSAAISKFKDVFEILKKKKINARDLEARTGQINELTGLLKESGFRSSEANTLLNKTKKIIDEAVKKGDNEFISKKVDFAKLIKQLKRIENATKVNLGNGEVAYSGGQALRRLLGNAPKKYELAAKAIEIIQKEFGIGEELNMRNIANAANIAEQSTMALNSQSLGGIFKKNLIENLPYIGGVKKILDVPLKLAEAAGKGVKVEDLQGYNRSSNLLKLLERERKRSNALKQK